MKEQYYDNLELMGDDNHVSSANCILRDLLFLKWHYSGRRLPEEQVWQVVDLLQNSRRMYVPRKRLDNHYKSDQGLQISAFTEKTQLSTTKEGELHYIGVKLFDDGACS